MRGWPGSRSTAGWRPFDGGSDAPERRARWRGAATGHPFGISFFGSTNGFATTVAARSPASGTLTRRAVPRPACSIGTIAYPRFFSSRGGQIAEATRPPGRPPAGVGEPAGGGGAGAGVLDRHHRVPEILLESGGPDRGSNPPHRPAARGDRPFRHVELDPGAGDLDADELPLHPLRLDPPERLLPDVVGALPLVDQPLQAGLVDIVRQGHVGAPVEDPRLHPADVGGPGGTDVVRLPGLHDPLPELVAPAPVPEVDLVADLAGPAGAGYDHRDAVERGFQEPVVLEGEHPVPEERADHLLRGGALDLEGRDVGLADRHSKTGVPRHAAGVEQHVAVREGEPEVVVAQAQEHRVVHHAAVVRRDDDVLPLAHRAAREIARGEQIGELERVRSGDLDLALHPHVPEGDVIDEVPVLLLQVREADRKEGVVVDGVSPGAVALRGLEEGSAAEAGAALDQTHVEGHGGLWSELRDGSTVNGKSEARLPRTMNGNGPAGGVRENAPVGASAPERRSHPPVPGRSFRSPGFLSAGPRARAEIGRA